MVNGQNRAFTQMKLSVPNRCVLTCDGDYSQKCTDILHLMMKLSVHTTVHDTTVLSKIEITQSTDQEKKHKTLSLDDYYLQVKTFVYGSRGFCWPPQTIGVQNL